MIVRLAGVLDAATVDSLRRLAADADFEDGLATAGRAARQVKRNRQAAGPAADVVSRTVEDALRRHPVFAAAARPKRFCRVLLSRYETGQAYGLHSDDALIAGARTDLSFTVFLSAPDSYDGGELVLHGADGETAIKLDAGELVLYPSGALHEVREVTRGERLACVGWVRSLVRGQAEREILFDLDMASRELYARDGKSAVYDQLAKARGNLLRLWVED